METALAITLEATVVVEITPAATILATTRAVTIQVETALAEIIQETPLAGFLANLTQRGTFDSWTTLWI